MVPPDEIGGVSKAMFGCTRPFLQFQPQVTGYERAQESVITITLKVYGGIKKEHEKLVKHAAQRAMVAVLKHSSGLLKKQVPVVDEVTASYVKRRLRDSSANAIVEPLVAVEYLNSRRLLAPCFDNNTAFVMEASKHICSIRLVQRWLGGPMGRVRAQSR